MGNRHLFAAICAFVLLLPPGCEGPPEEGDDDTSEVDPCAKYAGYQPQGDDDDYWGDDDDVTSGDDDTGDDDTGDDDDATGDDDDTVGDDDDTVGDDDDTGGDDDTTDPQTCDEITDVPVTLFMSADDSNSQAAPALARQAIREHRKINHAMRPYEFLNYYRFDYPPASPGHLNIVPQVRVAGDGSYSILVGVVAPNWEAIGRRPRSLTFSVDRSGSMDGQPLKNVQATLCQIAGNLRMGDQVSMVTWDDTTSVPLENEIVDGPFDEDLMAVIDDLESGGSTNLHAGLVRAYDLADQAYEPDRLNRVLLMSDGGANTGPTDVDLISSYADDGESEGIYMAGVGTSSTASYYVEYLMNEVTDAGKGAYVYIDTPDEAAHIFGDDERFLTVMEVAARDVRLSVTLPPGYSLDVFHGEEVSPDPQQVEPQHLSPDDAMLYHFLIADCDPASHDGSEVFELSVEWIDPVTGATEVDSVERTLDEMIAAAGVQIVKADAVVAYASALVTAPTLPTAERVPYLDEVIATIQQAQAATGDSDLLDIADLLEEYKQAM